MKFGTAEIDAIKFGGNAVLAVYFGATQVWSRTLYYFAPVYNDWDFLGNWWLDDTYQTQAENLPSAADNVVIGSFGSSHELNNNTGPQPEVSNVTVIDGILGISITVTGAATFYGASTNAEMLFGNAVFSGTSQNNSTVVGSTTFNGSSSNNGQVQGDAVFNGNSVNVGFVNGRATYNDSSSYTCDAGSIYTTYNSTSPQPVHGCTDPSATNYNPSAVCEDWSCCYCMPELDGLFIECLYDGNCSAVYSQIDNCGNQCGQVTYFFDPDVCGDC